MTSRQTVLERTFATSHFDGIASHRMGAANSPRREGQKRAAVDEEHLLRRSQPHSQRLARNVL